MLSGALPSAPVLILDPELGCFPCMLAMTVKLEIPSTSLETFIFSFQGYSGPFSDVACSTAAPTTVSTAQGRDILSRGHKVLKAVHEIIMELQPMSSVEGILLHRGA